MQTVWVKTVSPQLGQVVVAGELEELGNFSKVVKEFGGAVISLKVSGGFHSPYMEEASKNILNELTNIKINNAKYPVYSNYLGKVYQGNVEETIAKHLKEIADMIVFG